MLCAKHSAMWKIVLDSGSCLQLTEFVEQVMGSLFGDEPPDQAITPELANVTPEALRPYVDECQKVAS